MKTGIVLIAEERQRQIDVEGWTAEHDKQHDDGALAIAAACYAAHPLELYKKVEYARSTEFTKLRPFNQYDIDENKSELRKLVIAGALIAAEIDRLTNIKK